MRAPSLPSLPAALLSIVLLAAPQVPAQSLPDLGEPSQAALTPQQERLVGLNAMREARSDPDFYDDAEVTDYVSGIGARLAAKSSDTRQAFEFFLMRDPQINAFAMPGGFVGVNTGLLLAAQSESEMAGVLGHEISHVTQHHIARMVSDQKSTQWVSIASLALAILASRANSQAAEALAVTGPALTIQRQLDYSRNFEREADRLGLQTMDKAGFDPNAMAVFFERLQRATRIYEGGAPAYLQTHPLTYERIADMQSRAAMLPYRQVTDSIDFHLVRAKLKAELEPPRETVAYFRDMVNEKRYLSEAGARYGLADSLLRSGDIAGARKEFALLKALQGGHPMVDLLGCRIKLAGGDADAMNCLRDTYAAHPSQRAPLYDYVELLLQRNNPAQALKLVEARIAMAPTDYHLYQFEARAYAALNKPLAHHRAQAEAYARMGNTVAAVEQLQLGLKSGDGDYYQLSAAEARLRDLRRQEADERKDGDRKESK